MPSLDKRLTKLEDVVTLHLTESGEIRGDLKWIKKFMWCVLSSPVLVEIAKHIHLMGK